jgi:hypothetical protein
LALREAGEVEDVDGPGFGFEVRKWYFFSDITPDNDGQPLVDGFVVVHGYFIPIRRARLRIVAPSQYKALARLCSEMQKHMMMKYSIRRILTMSWLMVISLILFYALSL